jgi:hypothetical protein
MRRRRHTVGLGSGAGAGRRLTCGALLQAARERRSIEVAIAHLERSATRSCKLAVAPAKRE